MTDPVIDPVLPLTLCVEGPVISQDSAAPVFGFDTVALKDGDSAVLPGTQIKGLLREVFRLAIDHGAPGLADAWLNEWFGTESGAVDGRQDQSYEPETGRLFLKDLSAEPARDDAIPRRKDEAITRTALDQERGSAQEGMLQVIEAPWGYGDVAKFTGEVRVLGAVAAEELNPLKTRLGWAFKLIPAVGAFKTAGFGRLLSVEIGEWMTLSPPPEADETPVATDDTEEGSVTAGAIREAGGADFVLRPKEPFIVWPLSFGGNFFAGDTTIPGQVLKAVAARWLGDRGLLARREDALAGLVFRHARPVPEKELGAPGLVEIPLSVYYGVNAVNSVTGDRLDYSEDGSGVFDRSSEKYTMAFQPDWKGVPTELQKTYGHCEPPGRVTRTRTAIGAEGVAEDELLFTHAAVDPKGFEWRAQALIPPDADADVATKMAELLAALNGTSLGLGKTKAPLEWQPGPLKSKPSAAARGGVWRVVLQTPACLHGPAGTRSTDEDPMVALRKDYAAYWNDVLGKGAYLCDFMARQRLAGGYLARRYPIAPSVGFEPYLLTEPGSIFVLAVSKDGNKSEIQKKLAKIAVAGLPLSDCWPEPQRSWKKHPFLPEAGWGEVRISGENPLKPELSPLEPSP